MGRFEGFNKILEMNLLKYMIFIFLLSFLGSCGSMEENGKNDSNPKEIKSGESYNLQETDNDFFEKIKRHEMEAGELLKYFFKGKINADEKLDYRCSEINMDEDEKPEMILKFHPQSDPKTTSHIYLIDFRSHLKFVGSLQLTADGLHEPVLDTFNQMLLAKSRVNGTCDDGFLWIGYKLIDGEFIKAISFFGNHEGSSCGSYTEEDDAKKDFEYYSTLETEYAFQSKTALVLNCKISHWKFDEYMDTYTEKIITDKEFKLYYVYNPKTKNFACFNSSKEKLFEEGMTGTSFELVELMKKGKL